MPTTTTAERARVAFAELGIHLSSSWLDACATHLSSSVPGFDRKSPRESTDEMYLQFLRADMNVAGSGVLPSSLSTLRDGAVVEGRVVLQIDEIVNVTASFNDRYVDKRAGGDRTLKLMLTDGKQRVVAWEYRPIRALGVLTEAGCKVAVTDAEVRGGELFLTEESAAILGGGVDALEARRRRAVEAWARPNRPAAAGGARVGREEAVRRAAAGEAGANGAAAAAAAAAPPPAAPAREPPAPARPPVAAARPSPPPVARAREPAPMVDLTNDQETMTHAVAAPPPAAAAAVAAAKRKRTVKIDDTSDDDTPAKPDAASPVVARSSQRLRRASASASASHQQQQQQRSKEEAAAAAAAATAAAPAATTCKSPGWAMGVVKSKPFAYLAAIAALRTARGAKPHAAATKKENVVFYGWMAKVGTLALRREEERSNAWTLSVKAVFEDGTGAVVVDVPTAVIARVTGGELTPDAYAAASIERRKAMAARALTFFHAFHGKISMAVSVYDDDAPPRVNKMFGPEDTCDAMDVKKLGMRYEKMRAKFKVTGGGASQ